MKSKKKKNKNKVNILIAYNKSIASIQGIELAMLFCHAGFNVNCILLEDSEKYISSELLKEVTSRSPWSNSHKPNWVKADIKYPVAIVFAPSKELSPQSEEIQLKNLPKNQTFGGDITNVTEVADSVVIDNEAIQNTLLDISCNKYAEYINNHCEFIKILVDKKSALNQVSNNVKKQIILLPDNLLNLRSLFEKILSESIALAAAKALDGEICYCFEGDFSKIDYVKDLEKAFVETGLEKISSPKINNNFISQESSLRAEGVAIQNYKSDNYYYNNYYDVGEEESRVSSNNECKDRIARVIIKNLKKELEIVLEADEAEIKPTENKIFVSKHKNGLILIDNIETRLLPEFSCQSCFTRLVTYIKTELSKR